MKATLARLLKSEFNSWMKARFPEFQKSATAFGGLVYRRQLSDGRSIFSFLCISPRLDRFTVELALNTQATYPFNILPGLTPASETVRVRINSLIQCGDHGWWNINSSHQPDLDKIVRTHDPEEIVKAVARIPHLAGDAVQQLSKALPIFLDRIRVDSKSL